MRKSAVVMESAEYFFRWRLIVSVALVAGSLAVGPVLAQEGDPAQPDSTEEDTSGYLFLPVLFYTPETELAAGASVLRYFRPEGATLAARPSRIWATFVFTQRSQYIADLYNELYFDDERYGYSSKSGPAWGIY